jgi:hypothetical protein
VSKLRLISAQVQVNTIRGNRYLDDAGKIMNLYDSAFPEKRVGLDGLHMVNRDAKLSEMRVTIDRIWLGFTEADTLQYVIDHAARVTDEVAKIIEVTEASRFGIRLEHLNPADDAEAAVHRLAKAIYTDALRPDTWEISSLEAMVEVRVAKVNVIIRVRPVRRDPRVEERSLPEFGIMIDTDIFRQGNPLSLSELRKFLREATQWATSSLPQMASRVIGDSL